MSGQTVTILTLIAAIVFASVTGLWLFALLGAVVIIATHAAVWTAMDIHRGK